MKTNNILIAAICIAILGQSCKKFLDKKPSNSITTPSTISDLQGILDYSPSMNLYTTPSLNELSADNYFFPADYISLFPGDQQKMYSWQYLEYNYPNDWKAAYLPVYNANICLEYLKEIQRTSENAAAWDNVYGSALFFRSYYFSQLTWSFAKAYDGSTANADLGIVLRLTSDFNVQSTRSTVQQSYDRIITDSKEALKYLPSISQHSLRPSKAAAYGLLARTYLSMREYNEALKYADSCLLIKGDLLDYKNTSEVSTSNNPFLQYNKETIFYSTMYDKYTIFSRTAGALIDTTLYSSYAANDKRKTVFFRSGTFPPYFAWKGNYTGTGSIFFSGIATDEIYLIRAECLARSGNKDGALADLNLLLQKRYDATFVPIVASDADVVLVRILLERRKELLFRGLRWIDIKRLNKEGGNIAIKRFIGPATYILMPNANYYALPLPSDIISITGMQQNIYP